MLESGCKKGKKDFIDAFHTSWPIKGIGRGEGGGGEEDWGPPFQNRPYVLC